MYVMLLQAIGSQADVSSTSYVLCLSSCTARDVCRLMTPDTTLITLQVLLDKIKSTAMFGNHLKFGDWSAVSFEITLVRIAQAIKPKFPSLDLVRSEERIL